MRKSDLFSCTNMCRWIKIQLSDKCKLSQDHSSDTNCSGHLEEVCSEVDGLWNTGTFLPSSQQQVMDRNVMLISVNVEIYKTNIVGCLLNL